MLGNGLAACCWMGLANLVFTMNSQSHTLPWPGKGEGDGTWLHQCWW